MSKIYQKSTPVSKNPANGKLSGFMSGSYPEHFGPGSWPYVKKYAGFTLIELLVVALIIGILAAIALPQYEIAVMKARMSTALPLMRTIKDANEVYYMANGAYTDDVSKLDVQFPAGGTGNIRTGEIVYSNGIRIDNLSSSAKDSRDIVGGYLNSSGRCFFRIYYDHHPSTPGKITCGETSGVPNYGNIGTHPKCAQVCKSLGF